MSASDSAVKCGWSMEWLPSRWPAAAIAALCSVKCWANWPVRKNVAGTPSRLRVARIDATPSAFPPASRVSATILRSMGSYRYRGNRIPTPWTSDPAAAADG